MISACLLGLELEFNWIFDRDHLDLTRLIYHFNQRRDGCGLPRSSGTGNQN
jgi:hypothetical protein